MAGVFRYKGKTANHAGFFIGQKHETAKNIAFLKSFFRAVERKINVDMAVPGV